MLIVSDCNRVPLSPSEGIYFILNFNRRGKILATFEYFILYLFAISCRYNMAVKCSMLRSPSRRSVCLSFGSGKYRALWVFRAFFPLKTAACFGWKLCWPHGKIMGSKTKLNNMELCVTESNNFSHMSSLLIWKTNYSSLKDWNAR